jgi:hemolysin activation/secretion protein
VDLDPLLWVNDVLTAHAAGHYNKVNVTFSRLQAVLARSAVYLRVFAQSSSKNLDSYEKFALGGPDAVRAYPASDTLTDKAFLYTLEWRQGLGLLFKGALEGVVFYDRATGHIDAKPWQPTTNVATLRGIGAGLNWSVWQGTVLRSYVAVRGDHPWTAAPDHDVQYGLLLATTF